MKNSVSVRVPATTANVGPGFDTLGIALQLYNQVDLSLSTLPSVELAGPPNEGAIKMIMGTSRAFFKKIQDDDQGLKVRIHGDVPISRGLGSSVTLRLGIAAGLNKLCGSPLNKEEILNLVSHEEGHPDNAAPALYGGLCVSGIVNKQVVCIRKKLSKNLKFVAAIPDFEVQTKKARALLPTSVPFHDAVNNVNRVSLLTAAFWSGDYKSLGDFLEDRLHQPVRSTLIPQLFPSLNAAKLAGAIGGWLSGSGSTVMALALSNEKKVGEAMKNVFKKSGISCKILVLHPDEKGMVIK